MLMSKRTSGGGFGALLNGEQVRRAQQDGRTLYAAVDVVAALGASRRAAEYWTGLKANEPAVAAMVTQVMLPGADGAEAVQVDGIDLDGVLRLAQSVPSAKAERVRKWLAQTARERLEEEKNPELAVMRTRRLYEQRGYSRRWVDKRLRGVSARHELTGEWFKRGAAESDQYRTLTNSLMKGAFGMEVEQYRQFKHLYKTGENLRDHMTDLELALTALGETVAVALHRDHDSRGYDQLAADAAAAGEVVARTRQEIESRTGRQIVQSGNHRDWWSGRRRPAPRPRTVAGPVGSGAPQTGAQQADVPHAETPLADVPRAEVA